MWIRGMFREHEVGKSLGAEQLGSRRLASDRFGVIAPLRYGTNGQGSSATSTALNLSRKSLRAALFGTGLQIRGV